MKRLFITLTLFISATSFAQTKEETIAWINTYASDLLSYTIIDVSDNGRLTKRHGAVSTIVNLSDILIQNNENVEEYKDSKGSFFYRFKINGKKAEIVSDEGGGGFVSEFLISGKLGKNKSDLERVVKAINHLAKLYGAKEKPKGNTF